MDDPQEHTTPDAGNRVKQDLPTIVQSESDIAHAISKSLETSRPPAEIKGYKIESKLGQGAYGSVWLAQEQITGKKVAIKFFHHRPGINWALLSREVERLARLYTSRNIVNILDVGWEHDPPYFIMEYLEAGSLDDLLNKGPLPIETVIRLARELALGLFHAHQCGVLHCDLKPANILLDAKLDPRICDFGQSRLTSEKGTTLGTIFYMAPEQAIEDAIPDTRWDVYAYGVILYQMLTGKIPYQETENRRLSTPGSSVSHQLERYRQHILEAEKPQEHYQTAKTDFFLNKIIDGCLERDPDKRIANMQVILDHFDARENWKHRRPIIRIAMGLLSALIAILIPLAINAGYTTIKQSEKQLIKSTVDGDSITATILATSLQRDLEDRIREFQNYATNTELLQILEEEKDLPAGQKNKLNNLVNHWKETTESRRKAAHRQLETSWFITDAAGNQIYRNPTGATIGKNFAHRDYYHGHRIEYDRSAVPENIKPIDKPYISLAFKSDQTLRYMVAIMVPIYDKNHEQIIGLMGRTIHLWQLLAEWEEAVDLKSDKLSSSHLPHRFLSLIDSRDGQILSHPLMTSDNLANISAENWDSLHVSQAEVKRMQEFRPDDKTDTFAIEEYQDPVKVLMPGQFDDSSIAVFSRIGTTGLYAVVQEQRSQTLKPVVQIQDLLISYGIIGISLAGIFLMSFWWWIQYLLRPKQRIT